MPIRYIHNDPASTPLLESEILPRHPRAGQLAKFNISLPAEDIYPIGTSEFVDRQCFEAALRTLEVWESVSSPFRLWHNNQRSIFLKPRRESGFGAAYERNSIGFDHHPAINPTLYVGASSDAVSHEIGHAILDARRPELWDSFFAEVAAFHEGFSDCMSLLVALLDDTIVSALFESSAHPIDVLSVANSTSQVAESVAFYFRSVHGSQSASSVPRRLRNDFQWAIPSTLAANPTSTNLSREPHSFGQVFAGCFYDCINNIYRQGEQHTAASLRNAALLSGALLAQAIDTAPEEVRFFRSIGRAMIHADAATNNSQNHVPIRDAFSKHNVQLGSSNMIAPTASLAGPAPPLRGAASRRLNARTRKDLTKRAGSESGATLSTQVVRVGTKPVVRAKLRQSIGVNVTAPDGELMEVNAQTSQDVLLGSQSGQCVVLGEIPNHFTAVDEVNTFVSTLAEQGELQASKENHSNTHRVRKRGQRRVIQRVRFSCMGSSCRKNSKR